MLEMEEIEPGAGLNRSDPIRRFMARLVIKYGGHAMCDPELKQSVMLISPSSSIWG